MSALDFVIEVLREHEKELTALSEKLEGLIKDLTDGKFRESINEIQKTLETLLRGFESINQRLSAHIELDRSLWESLKAIGDRIMSFKEVMETAPSRAEVGNLVSRLSTIEELASEIRRLQASISETSIQTFAEWADFKREALEANLIAYQLKERSFCVKAFCHGRIYAYKESFPPTLEVKAGAQDHLQVKLRCGLSLTKIVEKIDTVKGTVRVGFSIPKDIMFWLSGELKIHPHSVVEGDIP
ncbi:hypothetical protein KEJ36_05535 [Candidatus Bathyarchaeota archaeon]|nr:hypothetical protein [Candidatus Bathyarchaeota archaeon]MBS7628242.1 hypothetical protein [Candidatus Bathyarchaeota archaeon]